MARKRESDRKVDSDRLQGFVYTTVLANGFLQDTRLLKPEISITTNYVSIHHCLNFPWSHKKGSCDHDF